MTFVRRSLAVQVRLAGALLVAGLGAAGSALAQEDSELPPPTIGLEEIVVTAQKRVERLQDVPISVTAFNEEALDNMVADSIGDLDRFVPNLSVGDSQVTQPSYSIRGITTSDFGVGLEPAVGVYIDGVYVGRTGASRVAFNDVERVEVLNGPQGTLFGRNAAAGAIQVLTNKPVETEEGWAKATLGNYNKFQAEGVYNLPFSDTLFFRGSALFNQRDGWIDDHGSNDDRGDEYNWSVAGALRWLPREDLDVIFRLEYDKIDQTSQAQSSATVGMRDNGANFRDIASDGEADEYRDLWGASATLVWDLDWAEMTSITAVRGYNSYNRRDMDGTDIRRYYFDDLNDEDNEQFSQEIRFASTGESRWTWVAGGNYFWESAKQEGGVFIGPQTADQVIWDSGVAPLLGMPYDEFVLTGAQIPRFLADIGGLECDGTDTCSLYPGAGLDFFMNSPLNVYTSQDGITIPQYGLSQAGLSGKELIAQVPYWLDSFKIDGEYESWAVFGDLGYDFNEMFTLTGGLRWTKDDKDFARYIAYNLYGVPIAFPLETRVDANGDYDPYNGSLDWYQQNKSWDEITGRLVLDVHVTEDVLLYLSGANGYKSGGFNSAGQQIDEGPLDNETVENFEVGIKSSFLDNRLRVNGAYFDYTYENLQAQVFVEPPCSALGEYRFVSDDVEGDGYELAVTAMVTENLTVGANTGKVEAEYTESQRDVAVNGQCETRDNSGADYNTSPTNYSFFVNYDLPLDSGALMNFSFNYNFREGGSRTSCKYVTDEGYIYSLANDENGVLEVTRQSADGPALTTLPFDSCPANPDDEYATARASYTPASEKWQLAVYVQNLMNADSTGDPGGLGGALATPYWDGSPTYSDPKKPEFYGMEFRYNFQ